MARHQEIKYVPLSKEQKRFCKQALLRCNLLLKKWETFYPERERHVFRRKVMGGEKNPGGNIPFEKLAELEGDLLTIRSVRKTYHPILENRSVEESILAGFAALARSHAKKWSKNDPNGITLADYLQEAYAIILSAMYSFTRDDIDLSTFIWMVLHNRMINVTNQQGFLRLKNTDLALVVKYEKTKRDAGVPVTFDDIVNMMQLSQEEVHHLGTLLSRVYTENQIALNVNADDYGNDEASGGGGDYTACRKGVTKHDETAASVARLTVEDAIEHAGLTDFEKVVIRASLEDDSHGWQIRLAKKSVNPNTGKPYSRMWVTMVRDSAMKKLRQYLESSKAA